MRETSSLYNKTFSCANNETLTLCLDERSKKCTSHQRKVFYRLHLALGVALVALGSRESPHKMMHFFFFLILVLGPLTAELSTNFRR